MQHSENSDNNQPGSQKARLYKIGQVAKMTGLQPFVLRFWEKEFKLKLPKAKSGHRFYTHENVQTILQIKRLLYTEGYTIKGALQKLHWGEVDPQPQESAPLSPRESNVFKTLQSVRHDLEQLLNDFSK